MNEPSTSPTLLLLARAGDAQAWNRLVQIYGPLVYRWSRGLGLQAADAADAMQETLSSVSKDLGRFDPQTASGKFRGWLWTITRRRIADLQRRRDDIVLIGSVAGQITDDAFTDPPTEAASDDAGVLQRAVLAYRDRYDAKTWQAFWQTVVEGNSPEGVAKRLGVSRWTVYKARARILNRLRTDLEGFL
ncbi:MAG TPA: sigma-70 family RNA polymerase sigma factor [Planctomycetaceae bacterium]|nr:sigma-70 family RNA polymerase sigma factor [Planctomycetaceae bacterium]